MNRTIKFRAWDGEKMLDFSTLPMDAYQVCFFHDCMLKGKKTFKNAGKSVEVTVMQYTGLTDKNGKEIYEGDVVRIGFEPHMREKENPTTSPVVGEETVYEKTEISAVTFTDGGFTISADFGDYNVTTVGWADQDGMNELEIIGNIYENPNLL